MSLSFLSPAWSEALCAAINASERYRRHAAGWTHGPVVLGIRWPAGGLRYLTLDVDRGTCHGVSTAEAPPEGAGFVITGALAVWRALLEQRLNPALEIGLRRLAFQGSWVLLAQYQQAALALVDLVADLDTDFDAAEAPPA